MILTLARLRDRPGIVELRLKLAWFINKRLDKPLKRPTQIRQASTVNHPSAVLSQIDVIPPLEMLEPDAQLKL